MICLAAARLRHHRRGRSCACPGRPQGAPLRERRPLRAASFGHPSPVGAPTRAETFAQPVLGALPFRHSCESRNLAPLQTNALDSRFRGNDGWRVFSHSCAEPACTAILGRNPRAGRRLGCGYWGGVVPSAARNLRPLSYEQQPGLSPRTPYSLVGRGSRLTPECGTTAAAVGSSLRSERHHPLPTTRAPPPHPGFPLPRE